MPRFRYKHIQSAIEDRAPQTLLDGEIAVNKFAGKEKLFIKNTNNEIVPFISEIQINTKIENKVDMSAFTSAITEIYDELDQCENPKSGVTLYGSAYTNVGISCDESAFSETTKVVGERVLIDAVDGGIGVTAIEDIVASSEGDIIITADDDLYVNSGEKAAFYGANETHIGASFDGVNKSASIIYERVPSTGECAITSTTVDDALNEVLDRSKVHMSATTVSGVASYMIWQGEGACRNEVLIPSTTNIYSAVTVSSDLVDVTCPSQILGSGNTGAQALIIYENVDNYTTYTISVADIYNTPLGQQIVLACPPGGYCEVSYLNINGKIYARGGNDYCGNEPSPQGPISA